MKTSTMTVKGQVTVPKDLREAFGWKVGDELAFVREGDGVKMIRAPRRRRRGNAIVEQLRRAPWNQRLTTDDLMALTRGKRR